MIKNRRGKEKFFSDFLFLCLLCLNVFLPPLPEVQCHNLLDFRNPWGKRIERSENLSHKECKIATCNLYIYFLCEIFSLFLVSCITCHMSHVTCHMSHVTSHISHLTSHISLVTCHMSHIPYHVSQRNYQCQCQNYGITDFWWCLLLGLMAKMMLKKMLKQQKKDAQTTKWC